MIRLIALVALAAPHVDQHGDPLPEGAITRFGTVRFRVGAYRERNAHALSPDGKHLAVDDRFGIAIWDAETGKVAQRLPWRTSPGDSPKFALCYSPDGKRLARVAGRVVALWDLTTGKEIFDIDFKKEGSFHALAFVPGADHLLVLSETSPRAFTLDAKTGRIVKEQQLDAPARFVSTSGRRYLGWIETALHILDAATGKQICQATGLVGTFDAPPILSPDDRRLYVADRTGRLQTFDANTGKLLENLEAPKDWDDVGWRTELTLSPDGAVAFLTKHGLATRRRDLKAAKWLDPLPVSPGGTFLARPNGQQGLLVDNDGVLRRYDLATLKELPTTNGFEGSVFTHPSPDGRRVVIESGDSSVRSQLGVFDLSARPLWTVDPGADWGMPRWSPNGEWLACVGNDRIFLRDAGTGQVRQTLRSEKDSKQFYGWANFTSDSLRLVVPFDRDTAPAVFDLKTGKQTAYRWTDLRGNRDVSPDGRLHTVQFRDGANGGVRLIDLESGRTVAGWIDPPEGRCGYFSLPAFSPDGSYIVTFDHEPQQEASRPRHLMAVIRDPVTLARKQSFGLEFDSLFNLDLSPNGLWMVMGDYSGRIRLWDVATGQQLGEFDGHRDCISSLAFLGVGKMLSASADLTALLWDIRPKERPSKPLWEALSGADAKEAWRAVWALAADPKGPELLRSKIAVPTAPPADKVKQWLADLGADKYAVREAATKNLLNLGRLVEPDLKAARMQAKAEEVRTRIDGLLAKVAPERSAAELVQARAVAALEIAGTPEARKLLSEWAAGAPGARLTLDAKGALGRTGTR